jgi:hypothetical protein
VCTIFFCYLTFPSLLPFLQSRSRATLQRWLWGSVALQVGLCRYRRLGIKGAAGLGGTGFTCGIYTHWWGKT